MKKVLFFGPYPDPITGQSIAFKEIFDAYAGEKVLCNITRYDNKIINTLYIYIYIPYLFITNKFDVVYFTCSRTLLGFFKDFVLIFWAKIYKVKIVNHLHGNDFKEFYRKQSFFKPLIKWVYESINTTIVLLPGMRDQFVDFPKMKIEIVRNSYPKIFEENKGIINAFEKNSKEFINITYLSNIMYSKGIIIFLDVCAKLLDKNVNIKIAIAGKVMGDSYKSEKEIKLIFQEKFRLLKSKYPDKVEYFGIIKGNEKIHLLKDSDVFVLPTFYKTEALPISIIEAMYYGNAIVSTKHNYMEHIVDTKGGVLVEKLRVDDLENALIKLINDPNSIIDMQNYNIKIANSNYSPDNYVNSITRILCN